MPKETFFNLPLSKQEHIMDVVIHEFYKKGYDAVSITSIVEKAQIAKGSFYQYFLGKDELYRHVLTSTNDKKMQYVKPVIDSFMSLDFFEWFKRMLVASIEFLKDYPILAKISQDFWKHSNTHLKEKILGEELRRTEDFIQFFIEKAIEKNQVRNDISKTYISKYLSNQLAFFTDFLIERCEDLTCIDIEELDDLINDFINIIKKGLTH